ncbi:hypothetical protein FAI40_08830 [Acetobacteraceae bacterium]|nr:hypothetical protein FAI40_08830 [Acetobacteraceae bacterium]
MSVVELPGEDLSSIVLRSLKTLGASLPGQSVLREKVFSEMENTLEEECSDRTPKEALEVAEKVGAVKRVGKGRSELTPGLFPPLLWPSSGAFFRHHALLPDSENEEVYQTAEQFASKLLAMLVQAAVEGKTLLDTAVAKKLNLAEDWMQREDTKQSLWLLKQIFSMPVLKDGSRVKGQLLPLLSLLHDKDFLYPEGGLSQFCIEEGWKELSPEARRKKLKIIWNNIYEYPYWKSLPAALNVTK